MRFKCELEILKKVNTSGQYWLFYSCGKLKKKQNTDIHINAQNKDGGNGRGLRVS